MSRESSQSTGRHHRRRTRERSWSKHHHRRRSIYIRKQNGEPIAPEKAASRRTYAVANARSPAEQRSSDGIHPLMSTPVRPYKGETLSDDRRVSGSARDGRTTPGSFSRRRPSTISVPTRTYPDRVFNGATVPRYGGAIVTMEQAP